MTLEDIKEDAKLLGSSISLDDANALVHMTFAVPENVYIFMNMYNIPTDSVMREKIFNYAADKYYDGDYDKIYKQWLGV